MCKILSLSKLGILLVALITCQGCGGGGSTDANAPQAATGGDAGGGMPSSYNPGPAQAAGASSSDTGMLAGDPASGAPGDGYNPEDTAGAAGGYGGMPGMGRPAEADGTAEMGYGGNYAAGMAASGAEGGGLAGYPGEGGYGVGQLAPVDPAPPEDADYMTKAKYAFAIGKEAAAHQYLYAHILTNDAEASDLLKQFRWLPSGLRPAATSRFAAAVILEAPTTLTDLKPIGTSQISGAGGGIGSGDMGMGSGPQGASGQAGRSFQDLTGAFGDAVVEAFKTRWSAGDFGTIFNEVTTITPVVRGQGGMPGMGGSMGMMDGGVSYGPGDGTSNVRAKTVAGNSIIPGLLFLGTGSEGELVQKAEKEGIDALFLFEVKVSQSRIGVIQNDTRVRLVMGNGKSIGATQTLNNVKIEREQMRGGNRDVEKNLTVLFKRIDTPEPAINGLKLINLPAIKPEHVKARIGKIIASKPKDILRALTEFRLYHSLGLITDAEKSQAFQLALDGSDGEVLATGADEDRMEILKAKLPAYK